MTWKADYIALRVRLVAGRRASRITQDGMAGLLGMSLRSVQRFEAGESELTAAQLFKWAALIGLRITLEKPPVVAGSEAA